MKPSNLVTPRTLNECHWTPGYQSLSSGKNKTIGGYVLAFAIGFSLGALLVARWSS
jgi:hypothetical protein